MFSLADLKEWFDLAGSFIQAPAILAGLYFGFRGLESWRGEAIGRRRLELAENTLAQFYEAKARLAWVRVPASFGDEGESRPVEPGQLESNAVRRMRNGFYVPIERLDRQAEFWSKFDAAKFPFIAVFGIEAGNAFDDIRGIRNQIVVRAGYLIRWIDLPAHGHGTYFEQIAESRKKAEEIIGWGTEDNGPTEQKINAAAESIEQLCRPVITGYYNKANRIWWKW